ncbi:MAG TPA: thymidylate kinase [Methylomusa anaerophila]|uniref:dTMP kinase n=1 Tax=Methylomusa anaerophila TaxID=1930071 RepID=UPI000F84831F|nr:thymidylate kinase [Methylomusa anaerophila]HML89322.1 thymidylate kinase [Methylomusa anaerophila]
MRGKLIVIEAGDGCGKETQANKLLERLGGEGYSVRKVSFPDYESQSSALVKMYLEGKFGDDPTAVNPYAASAFYAVDRYASFATDWGHFYRSGGTVLADRYSTSNMVHQAVKFSDATEKEQFLDWLWDLEFVKFALPVPDAVIFLDMPPEYSCRLLQNRAVKTGAQKDIHERNAVYLAKCYESYRLLSKKYGWRRINCISGGDNGTIRSVDDIHEEVYGIVTSIIGANK